MHDELKSVGLTAAQRAIDAGGLLVAMAEPFFSGGYSYTHLLHTVRGKTYRVSRTIVGYLRTPPGRSAFQCAARGCDGCSVCTPNGPVRQEPTAARPVE